MRVTQEPGALREINSLRRHWDNELILTSVVQGLVLLCEPQLCLGDSGRQGSWGEKPWDFMDHWPPLLPRGKVSSMP